MITAKLIKKIRNYAVVSLFVPLIAVNSCLIIYKFLGDLQKNVRAYPDINWNIEKNELALTKFHQLEADIETYTFTNCPKYKFRFHYITADNQTIEDIQENADLIANLSKDKKLKSIIIKSQNRMNDMCVKNHPFLYSVLKKFSPLETILLRSILKSDTEFSQVKNPYFYGEVSISRTARYFPTVIIFKTLIILSSFLLFLYWKNNLNLFSELKKNNTLDKFSKNFFYMGVLSCIFLMLHATFLGLDFNSELFTKIRRIIIVLFIFFELAAQISLTRNLFKFRVELFEYIKPLILKIKIIFLIIVFSITCIAFSILAFGDSSTAFKHILEWNYFSLLLVYYLLSRLLWKTP